MSRENPAAALAALNAAPAEVGRFTVMPLSLGLCGVLDAIGSPLMGGQAPAGVGGWAGTLFAMTRPAAESRAILARPGGRAAFDAAAAAWADGVSPLEAIGLVNAARRAADVALGVLGDADDDADDGGGGDPPDPPPAATAG